MKFDLADISQSLADYLAPVFPGLTFYTDPVQQALDCPCAFLQLKSTKVSRRIRGMTYKEISLDLTYLEDYNLVDLQRRYREAAGKLDDCMASFPFTDGEEAIQMLTYDRNWRIDLDALHYSFVLHIHEDPEEPFNPMRTLDVNQEAKDAEI